MSFASPFTLLFLLPWTALVLWLLSGQRHRVGVPFLDLWSGPVASPKIKRTIQPPPLALALALAALLLAILGAATPTWRSRSSKSPVTLIVDRGITMSAAGRGDQFYSSLPNISAERVIVVPPSDTADWKQVPPSAVATNALLQAAVAHALAETTDAVVVLSDQAIDRDEPRIIQIAPDSVPENVDIVRLAASVSSKPQVMVRLRNQSSLTNGSLVVSSGGKTVTRALDLPSRDVEKNLFLDLPDVGDTIEAKLNAADDLDADNVAWLVRQRTWPRIEARSELPAELRRMIEVYQAHRAPSVDSAHISVVADLFALPANEPAIAILGEASSAKPTSGRVGVEFGDEPVIAGIDWREVAKDAVAANSPGEGWKTLVSCGPQVLVAVRENPARQVWVGFSSPNFPKLKDYVIFWTNVFDWVGQGGDDFVSEPVQVIGAEWKLETKASSEPFDVPPGIYQRGDGARRALHASDVRFPPAPRSDGRRQLALLSKSQPAGIELRPGSLILSMLLLLGACMLWKRQGRFGG